MEKNALPSSSHPCAAASYAVDWPPVHVLYANSANTASVGRNLSRKLRENFLVGFPFVLDTTFVSSTFLDRKNNYVSAYWFFENLLKCVADPDDVGGHHEPVGGDALDFSLL